jgi:hypothetical protein
MKGAGALSTTDIERALKMLRSGTSQQATALRLGVTKNVIAGIWQRYGDPNHEQSTIFERLDALNTTLDRVLTETKNIARVPNTPKLKMVR